MPAIWRSIIVLLVLVIAVLQVVHITLLSRLESRKGSARIGETRSRRDADQDRAEMQAVIRRSSVLDSSGEFHIVNFLIRADSLLGSRNHVRPDVTLVTQSTANHLHYLEALTSRWRGHTTVTVFALRSDLAIVVEILVHLRRCFPALRYNTSFHLVYPLNNGAQNDPPPLDGAESDGAQASPDPLGPSPPCDGLLDQLRSLPFPENYAHGIAYPVNLLRNVARRNSLTEFVLVLDIDLLPNDGLHEDFLRFANENRLFVESHKDDKTVYVAPAFEVRSGVPVPRDKVGLLKRLESMEARPFYLELCWKCQKHTDYEAWQREPQAEKLAVLFEVLWRDPWEPFYFGRNSAPFYDERFRQYGFNRISQVCEMHVAGYKFSVLNNAFVVHQGLKTASTFHKDKDADQERNRVLFRQFKLELREKYPDSSRRCY
ncbi:beta-1,4-glucuronyltransferase 1-like [Ornithodoros turicata]|uniref:beta-1,4-glucuronyltransferase 1-like n=1 Tax=Ornithodoros turicata TaxID=34597 RepID=UPI0031397FAD